MSVYYICDACEEKGYPQPAVYSKQHASLLIDEIRSGRYTGPDWRDDDERAKWEQAGWDSEADDA